MNNREFKINLINLAQDSDVQEAFKLQQKIEELLERYLWEGIGIHRQFNKQKYRALFLKWHPDKLEQNIQQCKEKQKATQAKPVDEERKFLIWFNSRYSEKDLLFKALSNVKDNEAYYFAIMAQLFSSLSFIMWPLVHLGEIFEKNINHYRSKKIREFAKKAYYFSLEVPFMGAFFLYLTSFIFPSSYEGFSLLTTYFAFNPLRSIGGFILILFTLTCGAKIYEKTVKNYPEPRDLFHLMFVMLPFTPIQRLWHDYRNSLQMTGEQRLGMLCNLIGCCISGGLQIAAYSGGVYLMYPFLSKTFAFISTALLLINVPLFLSNLWQDPRLALAKVSEYVFTIYRRYHFSIKHAYSLMLSSVKNVIKLFWLKNTGHPDFNDSAPKPAPFWKKEAANYASLQEETLFAERIKLKKERNNFLKEGWGIQEEDPFYDTLEEALSQQSTPMDDYGHVISTESNQQQVLQILNLKAQLLFLKARKEQQFTKNQLTASYRKDLDHQYLGACHQP